MKRIVSVLLAAVLCIGCALPALAAGEAQAALYAIYGNNMLFQQKQPAVFAGTATGGVRVTCTLLDESGGTVAKGEGAVNKNGRFSVSVPAPAGGYAQYTVVLALEGREFTRLTGVVFGELWLASGQSNMQMGLGGTETGMRMYAGGETLSGDLRFLFVQPYVEYMGDTERFPIEPQRDVPGSVWIRGDEPGVYGVSAVAALFAQKLQQTLDMPVGVLCAPLGGSSIYSWLSREAIESDAAVLADMQTIGRYIPADEWQETGHDVYNDMTANYNKKIDALRVFRPQGLIWYQGETDIFNSVEPAAYARAFDLLQRSWSPLFGFDAQRRLPIIYTQIASYPYGGDKLQRLNVEFAAMQRLQPRTRAVTPIYDVPLTYRRESGVIHPTEKDLVALRMAYAAEGMVYGQRDVYTAATVQTAVPDENGITVTLRDTGNGLVCTDKVLRGFSICGEDGIFVQADARITGSDTLYISAPEVPHPVSAAYAYAESNARANLYASDENGAALPVSPFVTDLSALRMSWQDREWADCDTEKVWRLAGDTYTGSFDNWTADGAALSYADGEEGSCLHIDADKRSFSVSPTSRYTDGRKKKLFADARRDYSRYSKISFRVRNTGSAEVTLRQVRLYTSAAMWYTPLVDGSHGDSAVIPADGAWHTVTLDLSQIFRFGNVCGVTYSRSRLTALEKMQLRFAGDDAQVELDSFRFTPDGTDGIARRFIARLDRARTPFEWLSAMVMRVLVLFLR